MSGKKIIIIGNGIAGYSAASTIKRLDADCRITMISMEKGPLYSACVLPEYVAGHISRNRTFVNGPGDYTARGIESVSYTHLRAHET